jgi:hypothetical protein
MLSYAEKVVLALSRTVTGLLSLFASVIILYKICLRYREQKRKLETGISSSASDVTTYHRMLLSISILDILHSFWAALSTLPVPATTGAVFAHGTVATCTAQGFFVQLSNSTLVYMASLTTYFMLKICHNVSDADMRKKYEYWLHVVPLVLAFGTSFAGVALKIFNPIALPEMGCWVSPYPRGCHIRGGCTRGFKVGEYVDLYAWMFSYVWIFASAAVVLVNCSLIYAKIRGQEKKNADYFAARLQRNSSSMINPSNDALDLPSQMSQMSNVTSDLGVSSVEQSNEEFRIASPSTQEQPVGSKTRRRMVAKVNASRAASVQCILYVSSAFFTAIWIWLPWLGSKLGVDLKWRFFFAFMVNIVNPLQGVFNLFVFIRIQYLNLRRTEPEWSRLQCLKVCFFSPDTK